LKQAHDELEEIYNTLDAEQCAWFAATRRAKTLDALECVMPAVLSWMSATSTTQPVAEKVRMIAAQMTVTLGTANFCEWLTKKTIKRPLPQKALAGPHPATLDMSGEEIKHELRRHALGFLDAMRELCKQIP
jgi:hypothetical protein